MQGQTKVMWNFLEAAFQSGILDELLDLIQTVSGEVDQDMSKKFADLEEWFLERDDFTSVDRAFEKIYALMQGLTDKDTMEGLGILISILSPLIKSVVEKINIERTLSNSMQSGYNEEIFKVYKTLKVLIRLSVKIFLNSLGENSAHQIGFNLGKSINSVSGFINDIQGGNSNVVPEFMSGIFSSIDGNEVGKMADVLTDGLLDQKPSIFKWTAATAARRAKKRFLNRVRPRMANLSNFFVGLKI